MIIGSLEATRTGNSRFAERPTLCRVPGQALAKTGLCRVPRQTLDKALLCRVFFGSRQRTLFAECFFYTRQRPSLPSAKKETLGKENFKSKFEALNKFKSKSFELQSCITSQDL
jgi:hypothetical protein